MTSLDDIEPLGRVIMSLKADLEQAARRIAELERINRIAAVVTDVALEGTEEVTSRDGVDVPADVVRGMLCGVLAALGGCTDPQRLNLHPEATPRGWAQFTHLMES